MSWARSLPRPLRRAAARLVHAAWDAAGELGAIGPDDPRGRRFGAMGPGACLLFPQGAIYNEQYIQVGAGTIVGPYACLTRGHGARPGDADRSGGADREPLCDRPRVAHRRALVDRNRR